jgi:CO/xanthine dehydrogenase Mo-binding subunit
MLYGEGTPERCTATVRMSGAGVEVVSAAAECGQGIGSALVQVVRTELGDVPVWLAPASTEAGYAGSSSASRQTWMSGSAVRDACRELRERVAALVAGRWGVAPGDVTVDGTILVGGAAVPLVEALGGEVVEATAVYRPPITSAGDPTSGQGDVHVGWMFVAHRAVVDVDVELGTVRVVQVATAQDVGRAINPREVRGQIIGGISQGVGLALTEELLSSGGRVLNAGFTDYLVPTAADMGEVLVDLVEVGDRHGPYGAKGVGEPPSLSSTPAVVAAIRAATGRPCSRVPVRPWDIVDVDADPGAVTR